MPPISTDSGWIHSMEPRATVPGFAGYCEAEAGVTAGLGWAGPGLRWCLCVPAMACCGIKGSHAVTFTFKE